jgi:hypothetical protein
MAEDFSNVADARSFIKSSFPSNYLTKGRGDFVIIPQPHMGTEIERVRQAFVCLGINLECVEILPDESRATNCGGYKISGKDSLALLAENDFRFTGSSDYLQTRGKV